MRIRTIIVWTVLSFGAATATLIWGLRAKSSAESTQAKLSQLKQKFQAENPQPLTLPLTQIVHERESTPELLDPKLTLPQWFELDYEQATSLYRYQITCKAPDSGLLNKSPSPAIR